MNEILKNYMSRFTSVPEAEQQAISLFNHDKQAIFPAYTFTCLED